MSGEKEKKITNPTEVLLLDDHLVILDGLAALLADQADMEVIGKLKTRQELFQGLEANPPDLLLLDLLLEGADGLDLIREVHVRYPAVKILVFSMCNSREIVRRSIRAGASGYCVKGDDVTHLLNGIRALRDGQRHFYGPGIEESSDNADLFGFVDVSKLSNRELDVFRRIGEGMKTKEIARILSVSIKTIESHRDNIKRKLTLDSAEKLQAAAAVWRSRCFSTFMPG